MITARIKYVPVKEHKTSWDSMDTILVWCDSMKFKHKILATDHNGKVTKLKVWNSHSDRTFDDIESVTYSIKKRKTTKHHAKAT